MTAGIEISYTLHIITWSPADVCRKTSCFDACEKPGNPFLIILRWSTLTAIVIHVYRNALDVLAHGLMQGDKPGELLQTWLTGE